MIIFANGKSIETVAVLGATAVIQGASRQTLEALIAEENASFEELSALYTDPSALGKITVIANDGKSQSLHLNFTIPVALGLKTVDGKQLWSMKIAEKSALELAQEAQAADIEAVTAAIIEIGEMLGGE